MSCRIVMSIFILFCSILAHAEEYYMSYQLTENPIPVDIAINGEMNPCIFSKEEPHCKFYIAEDVYIDGELYIAKGTEVLNKLGRTRSKKTGAQLYIGVGVHHNLPYFQITVLSTKNVKNEEIFLDGKIFLNSEEEIEVPISFFESCSLFGFLVVESLSIYVSHDFIRKYTNIPWDKVNEKSLLYGSVLGFISYFGLKYVIRPESYKIRNNIILSDYHVFRVYLKK